MRFLISSSSLVFSLGRKLMVIYSDALFVSLASVVRGEQSLPSLRREIEILYTFVWARENWWILGRACDFPFSPFLVISDSFSQVSFSSLFSNSHVKVKRPRSLCPAFDQPSVENISPFYLSTPPPPPWSLRMHYIGDWLLIKRVSFAARSTGNSSK